MKEQTRQLFNLERLYQEFIKNSGLNSDKMSASEKRERRMTFFAACGVTILLLRDGFEDLTDDEGVEVLDYMKAQVLELYQKESGKMN